jgi:hypothetical protein
MEDTLTFTRLGVTGTLKQTLQSTNPIQSMFDVVRTAQRNVKRWRPGDMRQRWTAAGMLEAERHFRRVKDQPRPTETRSAHPARTHPHQHNPIPTEEAATVHAA